MSNPDNAAIAYRKTGGLVRALVTYPAIWFLAVFLGIPLIAKLAGSPLQGDNGFVLYIACGSAAFAGLCVVMKRVDLHYAALEAVEAGVSISRRDAPATLAFDTRTGAVPLDSLFPLPPPTSILVWLITLSPIFMFLTQNGLENAGYNIDPDAIWTAAGFTLFVLGGLDAGLMRKSGRTVAPGWVVFVPGYLVARARAMTEPVYHLAIWAAAFVAYLYLATAGIFDGMGYLRTDIAFAAMPFPHLIVLMHWS